MSLEKSISIEAGLHTVINENDGLTSELKPPSTTFFDKIKLIFTNITVEPLMVCFVIPTEMASLAAQNLSLEKACRVNLNLDVEICDALSIRNASLYNKTDEVAVQKLVATMNAWKTVIQSLLPTILLLFLGSWSDRHQRRKPCILLPMVGQIIASSGFLLCTYFFYQLPMEFNMFFEAVPPGLTGGFSVLFMGVFSYISAISSVETRTLRIGAVNLFDNIGITIGIALSGILYKQTGFYGVFSLALIMYFAGLTYGLTSVKEVPKQSVMIDEKIEKKVNPVLDFFDLKHIGETLKVAFKDGPKDRKKRICIIMFLVMIVSGPLHGEMNVMYLFVRYKFGWNEIDYSLFATCHFVIHTFGTVFSLLFFTKFLKFDDAILGMISCISKICACIVYALAPSPTVFYVGVIVESLNGTSFIAMRSIMSKLVPANELGKISSLFSVSEALMPLVYGPMYSFTYKLTIKTLPGSFYLLGGGLMLPAVLIFFWLYRQNVKDREEEQRQKAAEAEKMKLLEKGEV